MLRRRPNSNAGWLLLLEPDAWQLVGTMFVSEKTPFAPESLAEQAAPIRQGLYDAGWRGEPIVLGLAPALCLTATVPVPAPQLLRKPQAMRYHVEGWLPWSAEEFVSDYVSHKTEAYMAAAPIDLLKPLLDDFDAHDMSVAAIVPAALLALERHAAAGEAPPDHVLLWRHADEVDLFVLKEGRPLHWSQTSDDLLSIAAVVRLQQPSDWPWFSRGLGPAELVQLADAGIVVAQLPELPWDEAVRDAALLIAAGEAEPLVNLRRDELAGLRPVHALSWQLTGLKLAAAAAFLAVCAAFWIRGDKLREAAHAKRESLIALYEQTFPQNPVPDRILAAMRREHTLLQAARGPVSELTVGLSGDLILDRAVGALPQDLRFRVPEIRVEGENVYLTGEVRTNADADRIAAELRNAGFNVQPPRTQRLAEQGFNVHWTAHLAAAQAGGKK